MPKAFVSWLTSYEMLFMQTGFFFSRYSISDLSVDSITLYAVL